MPVAPTCWYVGCSPVAGLPAVRCMYLGSVGANCVLLGGSWCGLLLCVGGLKVGGGVLLLSWVVNVNIPSCHRMLYACTFGLLLAYFPHFFRCTFLTWLCRYFSHMYGYCTHTYTVGTCPLVCCYLLPMAVVLLTFGIHTCTCHDVFGTLYQYVPFVGMLVGSLVLVIYGQCTVVCTLCT